MGEDPEKVVSGDIFSQIGPLNLMPDIRKVCAIKLNSIYYIKYV